MNKKDDASIPQAPTQLEWKEFGNLGQGVMIPDVGFTKQLHILDPELEVAWDWGSEKWEIWRFPKDGSVPFHVLTVQTKGKEYRELGADLLLKLREGDPERFARKVDFIAYFEELDNQVRRRKAQDFVNKIRDMALDSFINIHCKIIQVPKEFAVANSAKL